MHRLLIALAVLTVAVLAGAGAAGGDRTTRRVSVTPRLSIRVPPGWHVLHGWLSDVTDPAPRLAVASFSATLSRQACSCGFPNVVDFPRDGAFIFVWEYLRSLSPGALGRVPARPTRFPPVGGGRVYRTCDGSSATFAFKDAGRVFQVDVYLGPRARPAVRSRVTAMLDSLRAAPENLVR